MPSEDSNTKSFLSRYLSKDKEEKKSSDKTVSMRELSAHGINPLDESESSKKAKQLLTDAINSQTQLMMDD